MKKGGPPPKKKQENTHTVENFACQAFQLLFGDEFQTMPLKILSIFKGDLKRNFDSRDFIDSDREDLIFLKSLILNSARLAFHYTLESFVMGEMEMTDARSFETEIKHLDRDWFLGSEEALWNRAISMNLPNMERVIYRKDDGQYFAHRLRFGQSKESTFRMFEFRREVIRGIWAN